MSSYTGVRKSVVEQSPRYHPSRDARKSIVRVTSARHSLKSRCVYTSVGVFAWSRRAREENSIVISNEGKPKTAWVIPTPSVWSRVKPPSPPASKQAERGRGEAVIRLPPDSATQEKSRLAALKKNQPLRSGSEGGRSKMARAADRDGRGDDFGCGRCSRGPFAVSIQ